MLIGSQELIRDINSRLVLTQIINEGPISRAALAKNLGLTKATISAIVQELLAKSLVIELGSDNTTRGRKPILLTFNPYCGHIISVDLGKDCITLMTCFLNSEASKIYHYPNNRMRTAIVDYLISLIRSHLSALTDTYYGVVGICIAIHGVVYQNQITFTPNYPYTDLDFITPLEKAFGIPVYLENEANLSIIGEKTFCYHYPNMVGISIHTGIGTGLIINHELFLGHNGYAGEFGHTIVEAEGKPCPCGNRGCLEQYTSEHALLTEFAESKHLTSTDLAALMSAYKQNDPDAVQVIHRFVHYMTLGINNILNMINPDVIVINSALIFSLPELLDEMTAHLKNRMSNFCQLLPSRLQDTAILLGGLCVCNKHFLGLNDLNLKLDYHRESPLLKKNKRFS